MFISKSCKMLRGLSYWASNALIVYVIIVSLNQSSSQQIYNIGGIFSNADAQRTFENAVTIANAYPESHGLGSVRLNYSTGMLHKDPVRCMKEICSQLINNTVYLVITDRLVNNTRPPYIVSYACNFYNIPVIGVASRETQFTDKSLHSLFLRTVPSYADEARPLARIVNSFKWVKVILIASNEYDFRKFFIQFTSLAYEYSINVEHPIIFATGTQNLTTPLQQVAKKQSKVIIFGGRGEDAVNLYKHARLLGLMSPDYIWIVNAEAAQGKALEYAPQGLLTVKSKHQNAIKSHIQDAVRITAETLGRLDKDGVTLTIPPSSCNEPADTWVSGKTLYNALVNRTYNNGETGAIQLNRVGDRVNSAYDILNLYEAENGSRIMVKVGYLEQNENVTINKSSIVWPGNKTTQPKGLHISTHLKIVTAESHPFVIAYKIPASKDCSQLHVTERGQKRKFIKCAGPSSLLPGLEHCCTGFCIDLLIKLAANLNFTYDLHLSEDKQFGGLVQVNGSSVKRWTGTVGEIIDGKADLIVAALTINNERAQYIEFSKPFKYQGITILVKKNPAGTTLVSFLRPFKTELWLLVLLSVHVVGIILYMLDRLSPFGRIQRAGAKDDDQILDLPSAMWFSWGVLLNSGIGEVTPRSFSARVLGMIWAAFSMIIVASYTANLAAFLVLDRPKPVVSGIDDPNLRNPSDSFPFTTCEGSSTESYFKRQVELSNMYTFMKKHNVKTEQEGIEKVKNGQLKAFIWDSPVLLYHTSADCDLTTAGDIFGRSGYGIGMPKGSPWSNKISVAILHFHESGTMEQLESSWIEFGDCPKLNSSPTTLGLSHMIGVFIMVGVGIGAGVIIVVMEVIYYRRKGSRKDKGKIARKFAFDAKNGADQIKASPVEVKRKTVKERRVVFTGINHRNGIEMNGNHNNSGLEADIVTTMK